LDVFFKMNLQQFSNLGKVRKRVSERRGVKAHFAKMLLSLCGEGDFTIAEFAYSFHPLGELGFHRNSHIE